MSIYSKESLENLRHRIDLVDVLSSYMEFKKSGAVYKGLCPFHDEKSPSFMIRQGDAHYHCFGCGAHGDAIQFLMTHQKLNFVDAIEMLAQRFNVPLEKIEQEQTSGPTKAQLKHANAVAAHFYQFYLLHTPEGHEAISYLSQRGLNLEFLMHFQIGLAPKEGGMLFKLLDKKGINQEIALAAGLFSLTKDHRVREFFSDRILFPIHNSNNDIVGFSGRKYKEETFGGKYVNTQETALFKKSHLLFGLNYCRRRIAKERKAIIVEGQIDTLCLIYAGFNITVAGQGTAIGEGHVKELLNLGVNQVFLALDSDLAGREATFKVGNLFQKEGVDVKIVNLPSGDDPDSYLRKNGSQAFSEMLEKGQDYLSFLIAYLSQGLNLNTPAAKNECAMKATKLIREWKHPVMIHETLRKLAHALNVPEDYIGTGREHIPNVYIKRQAAAGLLSIDPDRIMEIDVLRWFVLLQKSHPQLCQLIQNNLNQNYFQIPICQKLFKVCCENIANQKPCDLISLAIDMNENEGGSLLTEIFEKKVNLEKAEMLVTESIQKILNRNWLQSREEIKNRIHSSIASEEEVLALAKQFDELKRHPPQVKG